MAAEVYTSFVTRLKHIHGEGTQMVRLSQSCPGGTTASVSRSRVSELLPVLLSLLAVSGQASSDLRPPAVAGSFYERSPFALDRQVEDYLGQAVRPGTTGRLVAAVVPHAGYLYSGRCAAGVYSLISTGQYDRIFILAPAHLVYVDGVSLPDPTLKAYATPLGNVDIDREVCESLKGRKGFVCRPAAAAQEHAIEVQLPFLQKTARSFKVVPLICGPAGTIDVQAVSQALAPHAGARTLWVASSDFTHYGPNYRFEPFADQVPVRLREWLKQASDRIAALDEKGFASHCDLTHDSICGDVPIRILMATLNRSGQNPVGQVLSLASSSEVTGDARNSVSYAAIGFFAGPPSAATSEITRAGVKKGSIVKEHKTGSWTPGLSEAEKATLFAIARDTLKWCVGGAGEPFDFSPYLLTPLMKVDRATFVTLKIQGGLRGCIGSLAPVEPLYRSVHNNAVNAALRDPRFRPVQASELARLTVDVSILSPITDIGSVSEFKLGQQGIILEKGRYRAVYLPEVATEQGWTVEETLASLSKKAGLPPDAWREGARFKVFESVVLSE